MDKNTPLTVNITDTVMDDLVWDDFTLGAKWELACADDDDDICMEERPCNIGGTHLREPTVRPANFVEGEYGTVKKMYKLTFDRPPFISQCKQPILNRYGNPTKNIDGDYECEDRPHK